MKNSKANLTLGDRSYQRLIASIKKTLMHGLIAAQKALEYQRLKTYWQIGHDITRAVEASSGSMVFGQALYTRIAGQLTRDLKVDISPDTLYRAIQFSRDHPDFPENTPLTFTHYIALHRVSDAKKRAALEKKAIKQQWSSVRLKQEIARLNAIELKDDDARLASLPVARGELYVYTLIPQQDIHSKPRMVIDCGFKIYLPLEGIILKNHASFRADQKRVVRVEKDGSDYHVRLHKKYGENLYTYLARVRRVIDGDTLDLSIDVGFGIFTEQRARLKAINAPELKTNTGQAAQAFLKKYLSSCPHVVIRTQKAGMYGRWLVDVFALPAEKDPRVIASEGAHLNQVLLEMGHAQKY